MTDSWGMTYAADDRAGTPTDLARTAHARGDQLFQIDLPLYWVQGNVSATRGFTRTVRHDPGDVLGAIEAEGWQLEHVAATYVPHGESSMKAIGGAVETAGHGGLVGLYVFRRSPMVPPDAGPSATARPGAAPSS